MYERILVPLDGSEVAEDALPHASALARYIQISQREFNLDGVAAYDLNARQLTQAQAKTPDDTLFEALAADDALLKSVSHSKASTLVQYIITIAITIYMARFLLIIFSLLR